MSKKAATKKATKSASIKKAKSAEGKLSALDAAAKVLGESSEPMTTGAMIEAMAATGYWSSPNGQTPAATLYSAILREIGNKGAEARPGSRKWSGDSLYCGGMRLPEREKERRKPQNSWPDLTRHRQRPDRLPSSR